jgi:hypothetical protein
VGPRPAIGALHAACVLGGALGALLMLTAFLRRRA